MNRTLVLLLLAGSTANQALGQQDRQWNGGSTRHSTRAHSATNASLAWQDPVSQSTTRSQTRDRSPSLGTREAVWNESRDLGIASRNSAHPSHRVAQILPAPNDQDARRLSETRKLDLVEFNGIGLQEALDSLADQMGDINLVASPSAATKNVSINVRSVTALEALDVLAKSNGLWVRKGPNSNTYFIYTLEERDDIDLDVEQLTEQINEAFPNSYVKISRVGKKYLLKGEARDTLEAEQIFRAVALNTVRDDESDRQPNAQLEVGQTQLGLGGISNFAALASEAVMKPQRANLGEDNVINMLRVPGSQQVNLRVMVAEVNRNATRTIGLNFSLSSESAVGTDAAGDIFSSSLFQGAPQINAALDGGAALLAIRALRDMRLAKTVAEPNLTAMHGEEASFHAGGQFPVPQVSGYTQGGLQSVAFVPFGCRLTFTPYILDRDSIRLVMSGELSVRDASETTDVGGSQIQNINTRNFNTTVELRDGQTFAVAGLIQSGYQTEAQRIPGIGDLPFVGRLASADSVSNDERELVILVTPELVQPLEREQLPSLPGSDVFEPDDVEFFLAGRLESNRAEDYRSSVRTDSQRQHNRCRCHQSFIIGPSGFSDPCSNCINGHQN